jgi:hemolysin activation/secretion protein
MPETVDHQAGYQKVTGTGNVSVLHTDNSKTRLTLAAMLALTVVLQHGSLSAQPAGPGAPGDTPAGGIQRPGDFMPALPQPGTPAEAPIETEQQLEPEEEAPAVLEEKKESYGPKLFVREIRLSGNTVFSTEDLQEVVAPYNNRVVFSSELEDLRVALTRHYIDHGYLNSGAVLPDQKVVDGVVNMVIVEGRLTDIEVLGNTHLNASYIKNRLNLGAGPPLNVNDLQEQIQIILNSPVVETINSALRPGDKPGEASLTAQVKEGPRFQFVPIVDNRLSPVLGDVRVVLPFYLYNITGNGDILNTGVGLGEGLTDSYFNWSTPLNANDTTLSLFLDNSDSKIKNGDFKSLNIKNKNLTYGFRISHPFYRTPNQNFTVSVGIDQRESKSKLLGQNFAFIPGVPSNGKVKLSVLRFSQDWSSRGAKQVLAARSMFSAGFDTNNATVNSGDLPSGKFFAWLGQFQWAGFMAENMGQLIFRANVQLTNDQLFSMEQFAVGGALSVRGYRENLIVRDNGYDASLEYRYPLMQDASGRSIFAIAPFADMGGGSNNNRDNGPERNNIYSAGLGLRWDPTTKIHAQLYWGHAFNNIKADDFSVQDDGVHFLVSANLIELF